MPADAVAGKLTSTIPVGGALLVHGGKVDAAHLLHARCADLKHPGGRIETLPQLRNPRDTLQKDYVANPSGASHTVFPVPAWRENQLSDRERLLTSKYSTSLTDLSPSGPW